jgi:hypothetical protein
MYSLERPIDPRFVTIAGGNARELARHSRSDVAFAATGAIFLNPF